MSEEELEHYGTPRKSGRYPWGSGENPYQSLDLLGAIYKLQMDHPGMSNAKMAEALGMSTTQLIARKQAAKNEKRAADRAQAMRLKEAGHSNMGIGRIMGINESSVRNLLNPSELQKQDLLNKARDEIKKRVDDARYLDVGIGTEVYMGISKERLNAAVQMLEDAGYNRYVLRTQQLGMPGQYTETKVLTKPDVDFKEVIANRDKIAMIASYSEDGGRSFLGVEPPKPVSRDRIMIRYGDEGGSSRDGVIELRPGVEDLNLQGKTYAQVRIAVGDGDMYIKGMALHGTDFPKGVDVIFNTNKPSGSPDEKVFKPIKDDPDNPFGSTVCQSHYTDADGNKQLSSLNIIGTFGKEYAEGNWDTWSKTLSSQVLSKQPVELAKKQLGIDLDKRNAEFEEIQSITNPAVKKKLLLEYAGECDSAAKNLKAAAMPGQRNQVILPVPDMPANQVYAPNFNNGDKVVLIRHPHAGPFEIPELTVNNKNAAAIKILGTSPQDAIGINPKVAERLSGADFDGDSVLVIPNNKGEIKTQPALKGLEGFDAKMRYPAYEGMPVMQKKNVQREMGSISNLITDMTIKGANASEIAQAVRHSMVVIDAYKHKLNYKQSEIDNGIRALKATYQDGGGASTLISRAKGEARVPHQVERKASQGGPIDPLTGARVFVPTGESYVDKKTGKTVPRTTISTNMAVTSDARTLLSGPNHEGTPIERVYADYANTMKDAANNARKLALQQPNIVQSPSAKKVYAAEVASLDSKLRIAKMNAPRERNAQLIGNAVVANKKVTSPVPLEKDAIKKLQTQALREARARTGAGKTTIKITDKEWEAIQAGAVSNNKLNEILRNADTDRVRELATPKSRPTMDATKIARAKAMLNNGKTTAEVAKALGVSVTTVLNNT